MFKPQNTEYQSDREFYSSLVKQLRSLLGNEKNWVCNMSQFSGFIYQMLPDLNWAGFYLVNKGRLILGPYQGNVACSPIELGKGVCGKVAETGVIERVLDVHDFEGHIACDSLSQSELVIPLILNNTVVAVFDLDSPKLGRFSEDDQNGVQQLLSCFLDMTNWPN